MLKKICTDLTGYVCEQGNNLPCGWGVHALSKFYCFISISCIFNTVPTREKLTKLLILYMSLNTRSGATWTHHQ